jgi:alpha-methylacyl-CoA racemase
MLLSDLGAEVIAIDRLVASDNGIARPARYNIGNRGRARIAIDLKSEAGRGLARRLISQADGLVEGFRPKVMERLGLGPEQCLDDNPRLVFGRLTGWGQDGPLSSSAGHDLNYIALTGALEAIGQADGPPVPPLNLLGDYAGGSLLFAFGFVSALLHSKSTGEGQVVDSAMTDGVGLLLAPMMGLRQAGLHRPERGTNILDGGAPHYSVYQCADGLWISIAPIEEKFRRILLDRIGFDPDTFPDVTDRASWPEAHRLLAERFATRSRDEWCACLEGSDACFAPVLSMEEAPAHPHNRERRSFIDVDGVVQPAPAPRFSRTPATMPPAQVPAAEDLLRRWGVSNDDMSHLVETGVLALKT